MPSSRLGISRPASMLPANLRFLRRVPPAFTSSPLEDPVQTVFLDALHVYPPSSKLHQHEPTFGNCPPSRCRLIAAYIQRKIGVIMPLRQVMQSVYELESRTTISKLLHSSEQEVTLAISSPAVATTDLPSTLSSPADVKVPVKAQQEDVLKALPSIASGKPPHASAGSMSQRRQALNIPTLHRQLSLARYRSSNLLSEDFSTPITPAEQVLHTPLDPPELLPAKATAAKRKSFATPTSSTSPGNAASPSPLRSRAPRTSLDRFLCSPTLPSPDSLSPLVKSFGRRLALAPPTRLPRRLSYSRGGMLDTPKSPGDTPYFRNLTPREPLASPLCIQGSVSDRATTEFFSSNHASHIRCF
ncbi:uncharacterized protein SCHCODRAFT_02525187 [Schizophyllum commune H4-8]|uniref:Uncharacterized protein n=1 Tax=Schizophyllum commune (strain H4-8 / FGSC 9210) TaxID=578458 RepID=D8PWJ2_SCHCM|nr:uncharacterized protein SCHCODRAFT_02525187 [Schizophyllum commune H4-8]KAI5899929.1 hypothetical protein SCHCODRAFT_02525187 [Schizophyllum commune H4-8]